MKITILNGDMSQGGSELSRFLEKLVAGISPNHQVSQFPLHTMNLHYCTGCWNCWWKTPGRCSINDDGSEIFNSVINSDFVVFASPLLAGFTSSALKKITDRLIVLLHPYIELNQGECHHRKRYAKYPDFGLLLEMEPDTDQDDLKIVGDLYDRFAINFHSKKRNMWLVNHDNTEDIIDEICFV
ncbi:MAG: NAD(P)H-dependent oxidoreductase [Bacteroidales bacterium]|nr:NAD(P)H-dependent oxidoreductase [Bacteroidales bacterium]MDD3666473.1 NAD(P)H-dependent oxidoreductase [Bacteroidales bacterium]